MTFIKMRNCFGSFEKADNVKNLYAPKAMSNPQSRFSDGRTVHAPPGVSRQQCSHQLPIPDPSSQVKKHKNGSSQVSPSEHQILSSPKLKSFLHDELKKATQNFHQDNLLGEGGFGRVYKGWLDEKDFTASTPGNGIAVAVKKLKPQGLQGHKEWLSEVEYLGRLYHPNLVKLIGFCLEGENRLLVYEFMPQGSLESHLFKRNKKPLTWETRVKIAVAAARGLCFLHEPQSQVIYRDFKASNILLDSDFNAKLSDFGLARKGPSGDNTHVTTAVMGTEGYAAPEYIRTGKLTTMCDVYSFGVVLFELLTGRRALDYTKDKPERHLINWVKPHMRDRKSLLRIMDSRLEGKYPRKGAFIAATLALHCVNSERKFRPNMTEVIGYLEFLQLPKFMSFPSPSPSPSPTQQMPQQLSEDDSPPESPVKLGKNASSVDWPVVANKRAPSPSKHHGGGGQRKSSPTTMGPRKCKHRSRLSGSMVPNGL